MEQKFVIIGMFLFMSLILLIPVAGIIVEKGIYIDSYPDNAKIYIDECYIGYTPLFHILSDNGVHEIMLTSDGYNDYYEQINLKYKRVIRAQLNPKSEKVLVDSLPSKADVFKNGYYIGKTPLNISSESVDYSIEVELDGYKKELVLIRAYDKNKLIELEPLTTDLSIITYPDGAPIYIDGEYTGATPLDLKIEVGSHLISIEKPYFEYWQERKDILYPSDSISVNLEPLMSYVLINSIPTGADVKLDGHEMGATPLDFEVEAGNHSIQIEKENFQPWQERIDISYPSDSISVKLKPLISHVSINSVPDGANFILDGYEIGDTPLDLEIEPGIHLVRFEKENFEPWQERITISYPSDSISINLEPLKSYVSINSIPTGADVTLDGDEIGSTPLEWEIKAGSHILELEKINYIKYQENKNIRYPKDSISIELAPMIFDLPIAIDPIGATITVDNDDVPIVDRTLKNISIIKLKTGDHEIGIECDGFEKEILAISIPDDIGLYSIVLDESDDSFADLLIDILKNLTRMP